MISRCGLIALLVTVGVLSGAPTAKADNCYNGGYYVPSDCGGQPYGPPPYGYGGGYGGGYGCFSFSGFFFSYYRCN